MPSILRATMLVAVPCVVSACASAGPAVTSTRWLTGARVFSGTIYSSGSTATPVTRTDIYVHLSPTDSQYVGTTNHRDASELAVVAGERTIELATSPDGRTIVFLHDARVAPPEAKLASGVYRYELGRGITQLHPPSTKQATVRWDWLGARPRPFPTDVLPLGVDTIWAVKPDGESLPLLLLDGSALHRAAFEGRTAECATLVAGGANINGETHWSETPLDLAIVGRHRETALRLLELGASAKAGVQALPLAAYFGQTEVVEAMLSHGADANAVDRDGNTALHLVVLAALGGVQNGFFREVESPVSLMKRNVSAGLIKLLLDHGANPRATNREGGTALEVLTTRFKPSPTSAPTDAENARYDRFMAEIQRALGGAPPAR